MIDQIKFNLRWRMVLVIAGIPLLLLTPVFFFIGRQYQVAYRESNLEKGRIVVQQLEQTISTIAPFVETLDDAPGLEDLVVNVAQNVSEFEFVAVVDEYGRVVFHSLPGYRGTTVVELAHLGDTGGIVRRAFSQGPLYLISSPVITPKAMEKMYVVVAAPSSVVNPPIFFILPELAGILSAIVCVFVLQRYVNRAIYAPLQVLTNGAQKIGSGDLEYRINVERQDEFGVLAASFNDMTSHLQNLVRELETRVVNRTQELQKRTVQLEAVSLVSKEAAKARNISLLLETTVNAISDKFGFYHTGIFVLDDVKEWAILRAASSQGGKEMLSRGHRLRVGAVGIVGFVAESGLPRIAFNVGEDAVWFSNPNLPETRSEMALPLKIEQDVIGVIDVQSTMPKAFAEEDISTLQLMADQLAIALSNARLLEMQESALSELRELQEDYTREGWARIATRMRPLAYEYDRVDVSPVPPLPVPEDLRMGRVGHSLMMDGGTPVLMGSMRVQGNRVVGYLGLSAPQRSWTDDEIALVESVSEQVGITLESARLFETAQRSARHQTLLNQVLQIATAPETDPDKVLRQVAAQAAQGLGMLIGIFTFAYPGSPIVRPRAVLEPNGDLVTLFGESFTLSPNLHIFFRGLTRPELARFLLLLDMLNLSWDELPEPFRTTYDMDRALYVPIHTGAQDGFLLMVQRILDPPLDPDTRDLARNLANQIGVVINNLTLATETRRRSEEMQTLYQISLDLSNKTSTQEVFAAISLHALAFFEAQNYGLFLYDEELKCFTLTQDSGEFAERVGMQVPLEQDLIGAAWRDRKPQYTNDYRTWAAHSPELHAPRFPAVMAIPLGDLGGLYVRRTSESGFEERDLTLADLFAAQAVAALKNVYLTQDAQSRADELGHLYEAGVELSRVLDLQELLNQAAMWARQVFGVPAAVILLKGEEGQFMRGEDPMAEVRLPEYEYSTPRTGGLTELVLQTQQTRVIRDNREVAGQDRLAGVGLLSQVITPLRIGEEVMGVFSIYGQRINQFVGRESQLLEFLATQVGSSIQNALQFNRTERALSLVRQQARYQTNISQAVALLSSDGMKAVPRVLELLGQAAVVDVALYVECRASAADYYWIPTAHWFTEEMSGLDLARVQHVQLSDYPALAERLQSSDGFAQFQAESAPEAERELLRALNVRSLLALAVTVEKRPPDFLAFLGLHREITLRIEEISTLQTASTAVSNTLARETLLSQVQAALGEQEALFKASAKLNTAQTFDDILHVLLDYTLCGQDSNNVSINFFNRPWEPGHMPEWVGVWARWSVLPDSAFSSRYMLASLPSAEYLLRPDAPTLLEDIAGDPRLDDNVRALYLKRFQASSTIFTPLVAGGAWIGYVNAIYAQPKHFDEVGVRRLTSLAGQAAVAAQNLQQLQSIRARARREQLIREITERIQQAPDVQAVLETAVRELGRQFGTANNVVQFRKSENETFETPDAGQSESPESPAPQPTGGE